MGATGFGRTIEYRWNDEQAANSFRELGANVTAIWRIAAKHARGREKAEIEAIRLKAH